jgi:glycosyltransferase involved in cell wall biosynthesis
MAAYDSERYIGRAIDSILAQEFREIEVIVVDDGSTDRTAEILRDYADPRLRIVGRPHTGQTSSLNAGLALARGAYVARQDADDEALPGRLRRQAAFLDRHPEVALVGTGVTVVDDRGRRLRDSLYPADHHGLVTRLWRFESPFPHTTFMFRAGLVRTLGGYDERFPKAQDFDLLFRITARHEIACLPEPLCRLRLSTDSSTFADGRAEQLRWALVAYARARIQREEGEDLLESPGWFRLQAAFAAWFAASSYPRRFRASRRRTRARLAVGRGRWASAAVALGSSLLDDPAWLVRRAGLASGARAADAAWRWLAEERRRDDVRDRRTPRP